MSNERGRTIAIIGGAGFIGHHLALNLVSKGYKVHIIDGLQVNNILQFASNVKPMKNRELYFEMLVDRIRLLHKIGVTIHTVDTREYHMQNLALNEIKPQIIIHLAAVAHAGLSDKNPFSTFDHSLRTLENSLDWSRGYAEQFIYFSSSMVYGNFKKDEVSEDEPLDPLGVYGNLKFCGEKMVISYHQSFDLPYTIIRPSALYGPRCVSRRVGQIFIENSLEGSKLSVEGDGGDRLDFTYIDDLVDGMEKVVDNPAAINQTFNMTYGSSKSINDLIMIILANFPQVEVEHVKRDSSIPSRGTLSIKKAIDLLGYFPKNPLEVGFPKYIQWYREYYRSKK